MPLQEGWLSGLHDGKYKSRHPVLIKGGRAPDVVDASNEAVLLGCAQIAENMVGDDTRHRSGPIIGVADDREQLMVSAVCSRTTSWTMPGRRLQERPVVRMALSSRPSSRSGPRR